jgi:hypothetical protein
VGLAFGDYAAARASLVESLALFREIGDPVNQATVLMALASALAAETPAPAPASAGSWAPGVLAAQLFGFGHRVLEEAGARLQAADQLELERHLARVRQALGDVDFEAAWAAGRALTFDQAQSLVAGAPGSA